MITIQSDVVHTAFCDFSSLAVFLFDSTADTALTLQKNITAQPYWIPDVAACNRIQKILQRFCDSPEFCYERILSVLGLPEESGAKKDVRITEALKMIKSLPSIDSNTLAKLASAACLLQSRFPHLFYENTGIFLAGIWCWKR